MIARVTFGHCQRPLNYSSPGVFFSMFLPYCILLIISLPPKGLNLGGGGGLSKAAFLSIKLFPIYNRASDQLVIIRISPSTCHYFSKNLEPYR